MLVTGLDGREYRINLSEYRGGRETASLLHEKCRELLTKVFPYDIKYEEVRLEGSKTHSNGLLFCDFFILSKRLMIEVHGEQHYKCISHFYKNTSDFHRAKDRDKTKRRWCDINDLIYVELPFDQIDNWKKIIKDSMNDRS